VTAPLSRRGLLLTAGLCLLTGHLAHLLVGSNLAPAIIWPPAGIALGAALIWGPGMVPAAFLGTAAAAAVWGMPWTSVLSLGAATAVQALAGSLLLRRAGFPGILAQVSDLIRLALHGGLVAGILAAGFTYFALRDVDWFWESSLARCAVGVLLAHLLSVLVFVPIMICRRSAACPGAKGSRWEAVAALLLLLASALALAHPTLLGLPDSAFRPYPLLPFLLWLALRSDPRFTALGIVLIYAVAASTTGWGQGNLVMLLPDAMVLPIHGLVFAMGTSFMVLAVLMVSRSRAEAALRASEARFRNVISLSRNCMWETDADGRFSYVDEHAEPVFHARAHDMLGRLPEDIRVTGLGPVFRSLFARSLAKGGAITESETLKREAGGLIHLETSCVPRRDEAGRHLGWQGISRNVGDRVRMERDLDETHRRFRQLAENIQEAFWVSERMERFVYISPQCEAVIGLPPAALYADYRAWQGLVYPEDRALMQGALEKVARGELVEAEFRILHPRKGLRWVCARSFPFEEPDGDPMNAGIIEDVTDRKRAQQVYVEEALAQRDALIREVHHRIKNNLQTVVGLLRREAGKHPEARASIEAAIAQVQSVAVVHGLHGRVTQHTIMLCELLPAIVSSVSELTGVPIRREGVREGCGELRIKDSETVAVALILNELATNAVKHLAAGDDAAASPLVTMAREGALARIRVINPGGLPAGFDFAGGVGLGTGLGLVRALVPEPGMTIAYRQRGGSVEVEVVIEAPVLTPAAIDQLEFA
jgi:PAS domain S-box-containing protein